MITVHYTYEKEIFVYECFLFERAKHRYRNVISFCAFIR